MRRRIPTDLVEHYGGKQELTRALNTADFAEAKLRLPVAWLEADTEFEQARSEASIFTDEELEEFGRHRELLDARDKDPDYIAYREAMVARDEGHDVVTRTGIILDGLRRERARHARNGNIKNFKKMLKLSYKVHRSMANGTQPPHHSIAESEAYRNAVKALKTGKGALAYDMARIAAGERKVGAAKTDNPIPLCLSDVLDRWAKEQKPKERTVKRTRSIVAQFDALYGSPAVREITKQHVIGFKDQLIEDGQSPANINVMIPMLGTVLNYAVDKLHILDANPAAKVRVTDKRKAKEKRRAFEVGELQAIFDSPVYAEGLRPDAGGGAAAYWLPLLSLFTGARQTELGQLHPDDVVEEAYRSADGNDQRAWVLKIVENADRGQWVKNEGSERRVPIHPTLIDLGFIAFVLSAKTAKQVRVFPDIVPNAQGELMGNWSKWFGRYRRSECGLTSKETPFHSFRHTFKHYMRLASVPSEVHNELTGHETGDVADSYGGFSYPLRPLVDAIAKYEVPGLVLPAPALSTA